jgi:pyruvate decarboxylase
MCFLGDYNLHLLDELLKNENIQMIGCCNELNAGYAADGYARVSPSGIAVVVVTHMVGGLSAINAIAGAYSEKLKVIVINGAPKSADYKSNKIVHHTIGEAEKGQSQRIFKEVTCASVCLQPAPDIGNQLDAVLLQCIESSLPVYIEIPRDTVDMTCLAPTEFTIPTPNPPNDRSAVAAERIRETWSAAKNPVILIGGFTRRYLSSDIVSSFASKLGCAVFCLPDGRSHIPNSHSQLCGVFWSKICDPKIVTTIMESDLWVVIGGHWSDMHTVGQGIDLEKEQSRILDLEGERVQMPDGTSIEGVVLQDVIDEVVKSSITPNDTSLKYFQSARGVTLNGIETPSPSSPLTVKQIVRGIEQILDKDDIVLADTGDSWFHAAAMDIPEGVDVHMQILYCSIGWGLPASLGSQIAQGNKGRSILLIGDGAFQMTAQEVSTMIRMRSNAIVIILNNLGYQIEVRIIIPWAIEIRSHAKTKLRLPYMTAHTTTSRTGTTPVS